MRYIGTGTYSTYDRRQISNSLYYIIIIALARALFCRPDFLLLDEPTNMLDMQAIIWLERYLQKWPTTLLIVSHDRNFLDEVPTDMLHLHSQRIDSYRQVKSDEKKSFFNTVK